MPPRDSASGSTVDEGARIARVLLDVPAAERPTAIVGAERPARGRRAARRRASSGIAVPGELSVIGFDGVRLEGAIDGVLTTLVQPAVEKGRLAAEAVLAALAGRAGASGAAAQRAAGRDDDGAGPGILTSTRRRGYSISDPDVLHIHKVVKEAYARRS